MDVNKRTRASAIAAITIAASAMVKEEKNPKNEKKGLHGSNHGSLKEKSTVHSMHC